MRINLKTFFILIGLVSSFSGFSQADNASMSIGLGGGVDIISNKDLASSPLTYNGFGLPIGINGFRMSEKWIHHFETLLILPTLTNNYRMRSNVKTSLSSWAKANVRYQLTRQIGKTPHNYFGGQIRASFFYREYDFLDGFGWEFQNSLHIHYARRVPLNDRSFGIVQVSIPIIGYINRKPSLTFDEPFLDDFSSRGAGSLLKYGTWKIPFDQWTSFELDVLYQYNLSEKFNFQARLGLNYYSISFPEKVRNINFPMRCYINYQL